MESLATDADHVSSGQASDIALEDIRQAARDDPAYSELLQCVKTGFPRDRYTHPNLLWSFLKLRDDLYSEDDLVLYGAHIVVPAALRCRVLTRLHDSHRGAEATKRRARQVVYLPGID